MKLGIQSTDDLAKLGINSIDDVSKLGISKEDLSRAGIKEVRGANIKGDSYSTEDWYNYLKEKYGKDKVYLCTDEQALRNSNIWKVEDYRMSIDADKYAKSAVAYDGKNLDTVSMATSNSHQYNPTILTDAETFNKILEKYNGKESVAYSKYYEHTLTEDHIKNSLSDEYFTRKGFAKDDVKPYWVSLLYFIIIK